VSLAANTGQLLLRPLMMTFEISLAVDLPSGDDCRLVRTITVEDVYGSCPMNDWYPRSDPS